MTRVWKWNRPVTVREVLEDLQRERSIAYTTVMTVLDNLHQKGWVRREAEGRAYRYQAVSTRAAYSAALMNEAWSHSDNPAAALVAFFAMMSDEQRQALRDALRIVRAPETPADTAGDTPSHTTGDTPENNPVAPRANRPARNLGDKSPHKPTKKRTDKDTDKRLHKPTDRRPDKPVDITADNTTDNTTDNATDKTADKAADNAPGITTDNNPAENPGSATDGGGR